MSAYGQKPGETRRDRQRRLLHQKQMRESLEQADRLHEEGKHDEAMRIRYAAQGLEYTPAEPSVVDKAVEALRTGNFAEAHALIGDIAEVVTGLSPYERVDKVDGMHPAKILHDIPRRLAAAVGDREAEHLYDQFLRFMENGGER